MDVLSTRGVSPKVGAPMAVLKGIAEDGGLYVPEYFPRVDMPGMLRAAREGYAALAARVLAMFMDMEQDDLMSLTRRAYRNFDNGEIVPLVKLGKAEYMMELFHGPTLAFKDMALQVLPRLISAALESDGADDDVLVLTATSGDTGKAALEGFKNVEHTAIQVFYPEEGVADMQKLQMATQDGANTDVVAVKGNFDDAQTGVKQLFGDAAFREEVKKAGYMLSSANSINFGRLVPQVAYYVYAYAWLVNSGAILNGDPLNFCVPTGNFGNILAAYYARRCGVPIGKLVCASNRNNVLTDFFHEGRYDANRTFFKTMSPSMDILISSNLERLLFEMTGRDGGAVCAWMDALSKEGKYDVDADARARIGDVFWADYCTEEETAQAIKAAFEDYGYLMDTHTAVARCVYQKYTAQTGDKTPTVVVSTAHPYKFTQDVLRAVTGEAEPDAFRAAEKLQQATGVPIPAQIADLKLRSVLHGGVVEKEGLGGAVRAFMGKLRG